MTHKVEDKALKLAAKQKAVNNAIRKLSDHGYLDLDLQPEQLKYLPKEMFKDLALVLSEFSGKNWSECLGYVLLAKGDFGYKGHSVDPTYTKQAREIITSYLKFRSCALSYTLSYLKQQNTIVLLSLDTLLISQQDLNKDKIKRNLIKYIGCRDSNLGYFGMNDLRVLQQCANVFKIERPVGEDQDAYIKRIIKSVQQIGESYNLPDKVKLNTEDWNGYIKTPPTSSFSDKHSVVPAPVKTLDALIEELEQSITEAKRLRQEVSQKLSEAEMADGVVNKL